MFPRVSFSILLVELLASTADANRELAQGSIMKHRKKVSFGRTFNVYYNDPEPLKTGMESKSMISIYTDDGTPMNEVPDHYPIDTEYTCGLYYDPCDSDVSTGTVPFNNGDPYRAGKYRVCFIHVRNGERELVTDCKPVTMKKHKTEMITKAKVKAPTELKDGDRLNFKVKFRTPIVVRYQWIGLFYAGSNGEPPENGNDYLTYEYTGTDDDPKKKKGEVEFAVLEQPMPVGTYYVCMVFGDRRPYDLLKCAPEPIQVISSCLDDEVDVTPYGCFPRVFRNGIAMVYVASTIGVRHNDGPPDSPRGKLWGTHFFHSNIAHECGGELASILNEKESLLALDHINEHGFDNYWIGLNQKSPCNDGSSGCWSWDDESPFEWTHWNLEDGEPDGSRGYVQLEASNEGRWRDVPNDTSTEAYGLYLLPPDFTDYKKYDCVFHHDAFYPSSQPH